MNGRAAGFQQRPSTYKISAAPTGRARCRRCRRCIEKGATRVEICAFVRPGRRTLLLRCADCVDARFAAAVLAVHVRGACSARPMPRAVVVGSMKKKVCVCVFWAFVSYSSHGRTSCVVCLERPRAVVLLPCRHLSMCALCAAGVSTCPMCRSAVEESMVVFV